LSLLLSKAIEIAARYIGTRETAPNRGPQVEAWLAGVGLPGGFPWCVAFAHGCFGEACAELGLISPVPRTSSGHRLWDMAPSDRRRPNPAPGYVYVLDHGHAKSHVGIVEALDELGGVGSEISGNTFDERGGREGNQVARHYGQPEVTHGGTLLGFLDFSETNNQGV
jgi:hypothetical protein